MLMEKNFKNFFGLLGETKAQPTSTVTAFEETREGRPKAYIPNFFRKPPFGYPRYKDLNYYRKLAASIYVDMCETAIIDEVCSVEWQIVAEDRAGNEVPGKEKEVEEIESFFENPNTNKESWETIVRMMLTDLLELNSGIMVKIFNSFGKFVEIVSRDGAAFTKNPDMYGMYTNRADVLLVKDIFQDNEGPIGTPANNLMLGGAMTADQAKEDAAYFQYGHNSAAKPTPFGKREVVWFEKKVQTYDLYGRSSMEVLAKTVQTLVYAVESQLEYFSDNEIPQGVLGLDGMTTDDMKAFATQWTQSQQKQDGMGMWKKAFHRLPMVNKTPKFERLSFTNQELELIESQKWWSKMVWAAFGITATELGFTEDSSGAGNQIVQSSIARKRIILPLLNLIAYHINTEIIPEFGYENIKYKYKVFDVDEETKKADLYKTWIDSKFKTINEIRNSEGLDNVEWGDDPTEQDDMGGFGQEPGTDPLQTDANKINSDSQSTRDKMGAVKKNIDSEKEVKEASPDKVLEKAITAILDQNKKKIFEILDDQGKPDPIMSIKGLDDIPKMIKKIFEFFTGKAIVDEVIKSEFNSGWDASEKMIDQNVQYNEKALEFLQGHTFDNVKGMTEEISNDLKAELERGIINGESIGKLKARVSSVFNMGENRAEMIARTETNRADNNGKLLAIKGSDMANDYNKKWITHEDDRTSAVCQGLDGQIVGINEEFSHGKWSGQAPPSHVNCRSTIVFVAKDEE
jgi:SPP1 gp7 family putative phage head morphogenesis protein